MESGGDADSYEAAMRAADALFARAPSKPRPDERSRAVVTDEQPFDPRDKVAGAQPSGDAIVDEQEKPNGIERAGRILRVIDEPADPFAQMEAERAPKKRGRKPGSKNKPKPALTVVPALEANAELAKAPTVAFVSRATLESPAAEVRPRTAATHAPSMSSYRNERFSWVRKRLGPGEQWKRRLPKVTW